MHMMPREHRRKIGGEIFRSLSRGGSIAVPDLARRLGIPRDVALAHITAMAHDGQFSVVLTDHGVPVVEVAPGRGVSVLVGGARPPLQAAMARALRGRGHLVATATVRGRDLMAAVEQAGPTCVAALGQGALGRDWVEMLRGLRRSAPGVLVVVLLPGGAERSWRRAMLAGAFDALPESAALETVVNAVDRAVRLVPCAAAEGAAAPGAAERPR